MPRAFLMKPRPLEQVPMTSESSRDVRQTSSVDASSWLQVDYDVNNNNVSRSSSTLFCPSALDLTTVRPADDLARWPFDVGAGLRWWSMLESRSAAASTQPSPLSWRGQGRDVTVSAERSRSPSVSSAAAAAESGTAADEDAQHLWWSPSPHSDVSASGMKHLVTFTQLSDTSRIKCDSVMCDCPLKSAETFFVNHQCVSVR